MSDVFADLVYKLLSLGFFNFLTFILAMVLIYALLRQRKIFGENPFINGLISFSIAFFVLAYPIVSGISLTIPLTTFFSQVFLFLLVFFIGFLIASFFYHDLGDFLKKVFQSRNTLWAIIALSLTLFVTSGLVGVIYQTSQTSLTQAGKLTAPQEVYLLIGGLVIAVVVLLIAGSISRGG